MITPVEIQSKVFKSGGLGYDKKDVDTFMKDILQSYEDIYRENMELKDRIGVLNEGVRYYKTIEKTLQKALVLAEKTAEDTRNNAVKDAKRIEEEAVAKAQVKVDEARRELDKIHKQCIQLVQQYEKYKVQFKNLAAAQIELLEADAFKINIQTIDSFIEDPEIRAGLTLQEAAAAAEKAHLSDGSGESEYDFGDYEIEGQEEFDLVEI